MIMNDMTNVPAIQIERKFMTVMDPVPVLDTARYEHMMRIATVMAKASLIPDALCKEKNDANKMVFLPQESIIANCFMVVNQAANWDADPFAVAQCCSVIHGRLMFEGKLVHAIIEKKLGISLDYTFDDGKDRELGVTVSGTLSGEGKPRTVEGKVKDWHTGDKGAWNNPANWKRQLRYRGAREWARAHKPGILLGVLTDDEIDANADAMRMNAARQVEQQSAGHALIARLQSAGAQPAATIIEHVERETAPEATQKAPAAQQAQEAINPAPDTAPQPQVQDKPAADDAKASSESMPERSDAAGDSDDDGPTLEQRKEMDEIQRIQNVARKFAASHTRDEVKAWADKLFPQDRNRIRGIKDELTELALEHEANTVGSNSEGA